MNHPLRFKPQKASLAGQVLDVEKQKRVGSNPTQRANQTIEVIIIQTMIVIIEPHN